MYIARRGGDENKRNQIKSEREGIKGGESRRGGYREYRGYKRYSNQMAKKPTETLRVQETT